MAACHRAEAAVGRGHGRSGNLDVRCSWRTGSDRQKVNPTRLTHLGHQQPSNKNLFLRTAVQRHVSKATGPNRFDAFDLRQGGRHAGGPPIEKFAWRTP